VGLGNVKVIVNITSDKCYENKEWIWGYRENDPMGGYDPYSSSKGCSELLSSAYLRSFFHPDEYSYHGVGLATARAGNVIGGGDFSPDRLVPDMVKAYSKGDVVHIRSPKAVRPWQHILEPLYGYLELARVLYEKEAIFSGAWNFGPEEHDVKEVGWVVDQFTRHWGADARWVEDKNNHPHEAGILKLDCSKARTLLNWHPQLNIETSLKWTVQWYQAFYDTSQSMKDLTLTQIKQYENRIASS
jgi:CDP-glucose 4,6-dehydratase